MTNQKKSWEEEFDEQFWDEVEHTDAGTIFYIKDPNDRGLMYDFICKVEQEAYERGKREAVEEALNAISEQSSSAYSYCQMTSKKAGTLGSCRQCDYSNPN